MRIRRRTQQDGLVRAYVTPTLPADEPPKWQFLATTSDTLAGTNPLPKGGILFASVTFLSGNTPLRRGDFLAEIRRSDPIVSEQFGPRAVQHELARLEYITAVGQRERLSSVLLHEQYGDA